MSDKKQTGVVGRKVRLFLIILAALLVPMVMDQAEVDRETLRWAGRIAGGLTVALTIYGLFAKLFKGIVFVLLGLIVLVFLVSEGTLKAPRVKEWFAQKHEVK